MKETDTENPIEWPAWCYTANKPPTDIVDVAPAQANTAAALGFHKSAVPYQPPRDATTVKRPTDTTPPKRPKLLPAGGRSSSASDIEFAAAQRLADALNAIAAANNIIGQAPSPPHHRQRQQHRVASKTPTPSPPEAPAELNAGEKMLSDRSLLLSRFNAIEHSVKKYGDSAGGGKALTGDSARGGHANASSTAAAAAAAAAYLYLEKAKNEKFGSAREYSNAQLTDSLEEALAESGKQHYGSSSAASHKSSASSGSNFTANHSSSAGSVADNHLHPHPHHRDHFNNSTVKRERLSPATTNGGDVPARSRSATPSSFRGTPPHQSLRNSPPQSVMPLHNLSTNLLNSIQQAAASQKSTATAAGSASQAASGGSASNQQLPTDFTMPTCSDFMRSMAAKYNNMNPNDSQTTRRSSFFDSASPSTSLSRGLPGTSKHAASASTSASASLSMLGRKEPSPTVGGLSGALPPPPPASISPADVAAAALKTQNVQIAAAAAAAANAAAGSNSVSPFMASLLSSLPFSQGVFPPIIDMSSTQALVTLARAAKEAEIQQVLRAVQQPKQHSNSSRASLSPRPILTAAIQQAAQFITPALLQLQQHQQQQAQRSLSPTSRHSSPVHNLSSAKNPAHSGGRDKPAANLVASPLDLSSQPPPAKRFKAESTSSQSSDSDTRRVSFTTVTPSPPLSTTPTTMEASTPARDNQRVGSTKARQCQAQSEEVQSWTVDDVCAFVGDIDICSEYIQHFRDQQIDGSGLPLLTEDHLVNSLGMKLGPALKLRSVLAKKLGGPCPCVACVAQAQQILALQAAPPAAAAAAPSSAAAAHSLEEVATTTTTTTTTTSPVALRVSSGGPAAAGGGTGDCTTTHQSIGNGAFSAYETNSCGSAATATASGSSSNPATTTSAPAKPGPSPPTICHNNEAKSNDGNNNDSSSSNCNASGDDAVEVLLGSANIKQRKRSGSGDSDSGGGS